jgi:hypothetical protein
MLLHVHVQLLHVPLLRHARLATAAAGLAAGGRPCVAPPFWEILSSRARHASAAALLLLLHTQCYLSRSSRHHCCSVCCALIAWIICDRSKQQQNKVMLEADTTHVDTTTPWNA